MVKSQGTLYSLGYHPTREDAEAVEDEFRAANGLTKRISRTKLYAEATKLRQEGWSIAQIAQKFQKSPFTIHDTIIRGNQGHYAN